MNITRETLELAAKAAGIDLYWHCEEGKEPVPFDDLIEWAPCIDRGQLLDLAMACKIELMPMTDEICYAVKGAAGFRFVNVNCQDFPALAEAVIQAAAEQQLAKEKI